MSFDKIENAMMQKFESEINTTLCWNCSKRYDIHADVCPYCNAANGNVDLESETIIRPQPMPAGIDGFTD